MTEYLIDLEGRKFIRDKDLQIIFLYADYGFKLEWLWPDEVHDKLLPAIMHTGYRVTKSKLTVLKEPSSFETYELEIEANLDYLDEAFEKMIEGNYNTGYLVTTGNNDSLLLLEP